MRAVRAEGVSTSPGGRRALHLHPVLNEADIYGDGRLRQPVSMEAIQEINIAISQYDVTERGYTGAGINAVTKSAGNLCISALAGTGKSATLRMIERVVKTKPILYLAFNNLVVTSIDVFI